MTSSTEELQDPGPALEPGATPDGEHIPPDQARTEQDPVAFFQRPDWRVAGMSLTMKLAVLVFGVISFEVIENKRVEPYAGWLKIWDRWDAVHYQSLARSGYQAIGEGRFLLVFFPLYPWLIRSLTAVDHDDLLSAFIVSGVASLALAIFLRRLIVLDHEPEMAARACWFLFIFPTSYFLHIGYTESLFLALVLGCFWAARTNRWALAGLLGGLSCLTRINGLVLIPALLAEAAQQYREDRVRRWRWLWIGAIALGFGAYLALNLHVSGHALTFMQYQQEHWFRTLAWPWTGIDGAMQSFWWREPSDAIMIVLLELLFMMLGLGCTIWSWFKLRPGYSTWMTGNWLIFTCTSFLLSVPRYTLVMFPVYLLFARLAARPFWNWLLTAWSLMFLALFVCQFVRGHWAF